jgi:hypothetical protein
MGIVKIRIDKFSELSYQTTGSSKPVPVKIPLTMRKGIKRMNQTEYILESAFPLRRN